ncbi:hypothetical protein [Spongiimicrobium sp. 2-473A-2-J]|uniref:hypothetical protein n=1 Tax=Eudoraea algarum TaxID=3417568 RepID=UPI003D361AB3
MLGKTVYKGIKKSPENSGDLLYKEALEIKTNAFFQVTTIDGDMCRRLMEFDKNLEVRGLQHRANSEALLREMVPATYLEPLRKLVDVLNEDRFFNRMTLYDPQLYTTTPLNRIVDAAPPESYVSYRFNRDVDLFLEAADPDAKKRIKAQLEGWSANHDRLMPLFGTVDDFIEDDNITVSISAYSEKMELLREIEPHSINLSTLSKHALQALNGNPKGGGQQQLDTLLIRARKAHGATLLSIADGLSKLIKDKQGNLE